MFAYLQCRYGDWLLLCLSLLLGNGLVEIVLSAKCGWSLWCLALLLGNCPIEPMLSAKCGWLLKRGLVWLVAIDCLGLLLGNA